MTTRLLGLDLGDRTIGLSLSDPFGWTAQGIGTIRRRSLELDIAALAQLTSEHEVKGIVLGLPRNMDGSEGERAEKTRMFGQQLESELKIPVHYWDERLTTVAAERVLLEADMSRKRRRQVIDQQAAVLILEGFLRRLESRSRCEREL